MTELTIKPQTAQAELLPAIPLFRYRAYHADEPLFMGKPVLQKLVYHDSNRDLLRYGTAEDPMAELCIHTSATIVPRDFYEMLNESE